VILWDFKIKLIESANPTRATLHLSQFWKPVVLAKCCATWPMSESLPASSDF